jgi:hypothetical protein
MENQHYDTVPSKLKTVLLSKCDCERLQSELPKGKGAANIQITTELSAPEDEIIAPGQDFRVGVEVQILGRTGDDDTEPVDVFRASCKMDGFFEIIGDRSIPHAALDKALWIHAMQVYLLAREHLVETLRRMGFLGVQIPFYLEAPPKADPAMSP